VEDDAAGDFCGDTEDDLWTLPGSTEFDGSAEAAFRSRQYVLPHSDDCLVHTYQRPQIARLAADLLR
jgi:hypothetical protein